MRRLWILVLLLAALAPPAAARAADPLGLACADQGDGIRLCQGRVKTFDGVPLDANLALPAGSSLPLVVLSHGYGGSKLGYADMKPWAERGYAVLAFSARGFGESCGSAASRLADPVGCAQGWVRLDDVRYEARDIQQLAGLLADAGVVDGQKVGVTGGSYGGGVSLDLAVLRDRVVLPDGSLRAWTSPAGRPMRIAAAVPWIPWSDLAYALAPNGRTLDYEVTSPTADLEPFGIAKQSFVAGLYASGQASGYYAPPGVDPDADLTTWFAEINAGEPYGAQERAIADELAAHHSAYYLDHSRAPAPTLIANGWTDDLFPVDEALRYYNRTRAQYPDAPLALMFLDFGHQRGQNKDADVARFEQRAYAWMDRYVKGDARAPALQGVEALTQTCPKSAASGGPYDAPTWQALHPGEVRFTSATAQTVLSVGGDPTVARAFDPIAGDGACATTSAADEPGTASYRLPEATGDGYTLLGAPTVIADLKLTGSFPELALRLLDVAPDGTQTLVARGLYRPTADGRQVFQLHPGAWRFAAGHVARLELLGRDAPYGRASNGTFMVGVRSLELRLPVRERRGAEVRRPLAPVPGR
ncbi:MAG TPA: CocE/NonD family hydrolase [Solirubrobacteraceae bacterium]